MASALGFIHASKIVHNNIKPANILYNTARGAILTDFGASFMDGHPIPTGGTQWYLAPEFQQDWSLRGPLSDVWALGVVLLWLLGRIKLPECYQGWTIDHIHCSEPGSRDYTRAHTAMKEWTDNIIRKASEDINEEEEPLEYLLRDMLTQRQKDRINSRELKSLIEGKKLWGCNNEEEEENEEEER